MSFAIIETGGKQYKVSASKILEIEKLNAKVGETIKFKNVLLLNDDKTTEVGNPSIDGATVEAKLLEKNHNWVGPTKKELDSISSNEFGINDKGRMYYFWCEINDSNADAEHPRQSSLLGSYLKSLLPKNDSLKSFHAYRKMSVKIKFIHTVTEIKNILQPEFENKKYITSFLFKLKSKPAALYQSLGGFAINGVNLTKLQSYPEKNSFDSYFFLCDLDGHIEDNKVQKSLEELGLHCEDFHVLGVFEADKIREK